MSVRAMRAEVGTESVPDAAGWSRIVFIAAVCALGGVGFLGATVVMNGRALSFQRSGAAAVAEAALPAPAPEPVAQAPAKPKPPVNDHFQPVDFAPRPGINKATLARCRSHVEAGRPFESLSLKRIAEIRELRKSGESDPEAICADYLAAEARQIPGLDQLRR
ncbi:MAG: hypothetical protein QOH98_1006 [Methylobacteriaceae bacterium]|nr:hypothetical protein [Methylobacteriaceae bacterium]